METYSSLKRIKFNEFYRTIRNFGVTLEGLLNKIIKKCEKDILLDPDKNINTVLNNLIEVNKVLGNQEYGEKINQLNTDIHSDPKIKKEFIRSINNGGMFFEAPCFANVDLTSLMDISIDLFDTNTNDSIQIPQEAFEWVKSELNMNMPIPKKDITYDDIYNSPIYIIKLKQLSNSKMNVRDFGEYSSSKKTPISDKNNENKASKLGNMEMDSLLSHNTIEAIKEFRTVKSDAMNLKSELVSQIMSTGTYNLPPIKPKNFTRDIIKSYITFLNEN
jgi:hypothetical protein